MYRVEYCLFGDAGSYQCGTLDGAYELCKEIKQHKSFEVGVDEITFNIYFDDELLEELTL